MNPEFFIVPLIMGQVSYIITALKTGNILFDCCICGLLYLLYVNRRIIKRRLLSLSTYISNKQTVVLMTFEKKRSLKFRAIMHHISNSNKTIYKVKEICDISWDDDDETVKEKFSEYQIDQSKEFSITDNIFGVITNNSKERYRGFNGTEYIEYNVLKIYSYKLTLLELQNWITTTVKDYKQYLKTSSNETQLYITVSTGKKRIESEGRSSKGSKANDIIIEAVPWESTIRFENSYFNDMKAIIKKIDFFLNNKQWYLNKGIPYNLGILLYGEPGCGKTRFIKQLMNHTGRHAIDIKMNDSMQFQDLYNIIFKEEINDEYIIPQEERILIFEDIDAMGETVKSRDVKETGKEFKNKQEHKHQQEYKNQQEYKHQQEHQLQQAIDEGFVKIGSSNSLCDMIDKKTSSSSSSTNTNAIDIISELFSCDMKNTNNDGKNNLSCLLNMLDGINECSGRIIIMTSNKPEVLDKALIRPGRVDIKIHFQKCSTYDVMSLINLFWEMEITEDMLISDINYKYTSAEVYNIFRTSNNFKDIKPLFIK